MKSITDQLFEQAQGIITLQPEVSDTTGRYFMADSGGIETAVGEFLFGLVKILQPENILETGTYSGISSLYMAQALKDNKHGHLTTIEYENTHKLRAESLWNSCGVSDYVTCVLQSSLDFKPEKQYDLLFLDSECNLRFKELVKFYPNLKEGGYVFIHDLGEHWSQGNINPDHPEIPSYPFGNLPEQIIEWVRQDKLRPISFPSPRGLSGFYKTKESDYKWDINN